MLNQAGVGSAGRTNVLLLWVDGGVGLVVEPIVDPVDRRTTEVGGGVEAVPDAKVLGERLVVHRGVIVTRPSLLGVFDRLVGQFVHTDHVPDRTGPVTPAQAAVSSIRVPMLLAT